MTTLKRYDAWPAVSRLQNEINRVFGSYTTGDSDSATAEWSPAVDIREYTDRFELLIDLPGVDPKAVEMTLDAGVLMISGERQDERDAGNGEVAQARTERPFGRFHRRFILPDTADTENVNASGKNGVLAVSILKHAKAQPRRITVS